MEMNARHPEITVELDRSVPMRDRTVLRADVYRPAGAGRLPVLLARTPYGKQVLAETLWTGLDPVATAARGFVVVVQDVRGRFASGGEWLPLANEGKDGFDTVAWAGALPWSNGRVGMFGGSYCGNVQWLAAIEQPPALAAISPFLTWSEPGDGLFWRGGAIELGLLLAWSLLTGFDWIERQEGSDDELASRASDLADEWDQLNTRGYWELPVPGLPTLRRHRVPELGSVAALSDPELAAATRVAGRHQLVGVPSFNTGGWHDVFLQGTIDNYETMAARGAESRLLIGPWAHEQFLDPVGEALYGLRSFRDGAAVHPHGDWNDFQLAWLRRQLQPETEVELPEKPVRIFVMGRNEWRDEAGWPLARARSARWFLDGDGSLSPRPPEGERTSEFLYDPADPVPTLGGQCLLSPGYPPGAFDQRPVEERTDVLSFTSEPLARDLEVTGRVRVVLAAESTAPATDWVARLCDVDPAGRSLNLCDGILRARVDGGGEYEIDLWSTSNVFLAGHRLRLQVTSSCFPRWDRNLNTGKQGESRIEVARQRLHHGPRRACYLELPIVAG
jgi:putative CocE/NonD family hydrolase